jgi:protein-disulfide isomerase
MPRTPTKRNSPTPLYVILGLVVLVGAGILLYQVLGWGGEAAREPVEVALSPAELQRVEGIAMGREDAPVVIYEFGDFQCPACGQYATFVTPLIKEQLVEPGLVRFVYYDFPLTSIHPNAFLAARAARCAEEQERFWGYHDILYARQPTWSVMEDPTDYFVELAGEAGLEVDPFEACLRSDRYAEEVTRSLRLGESLGVRGTPTIFVNGKRLPQPPTFSELEQIVREEAGLPAAGGDSVPAPAGV